MTKEQMIANDSFKEWLLNTDFSDMNDEALATMLNGLTAPKLKALYSKWELAKDEKVKTDSSSAKTVATTRRVGFKKLHLFPELKVSETGKVFGGVFELSSIVGAGLKMDDAGNEIVYDGTDRIWRTIGQMNVICFEAGVDLNEEDAVIIETPDGIVKAYPEAYKMLRTLTAELDSVLITDRQVRVGDTYRYKGEEVAYNRTFVKTDIELKGVDYNLFNMKMSTEAKYLAKAKTDILAKAGQLF